MNTLSLYSRESYNPLYGNGQEGYENNAVDGCRLRAAGCHTGGRGRVDAHALPYLQGFNLRGKVTSDTRISFRMSDIRRGLLNRMLVDGYANLHGLQIEDVGDVDRIAAGNMTVKFLGKARSATPKAVRGSLFDFDAVVDRFSVLAAGCKAVASSVSLSTTVSDPGTLTATNLPNDVPFNINLRAATLSIGDPDDTIRINLGDAEVSSVISARMLENMQADLYDVRIKGGVAILFRPGDFAGGKRRRRTTSCRTFRFNPAGGSVRDAGPVECRQPFVDRFAPFAADAGRAAVTGADIDYEQLAPIPPGQRAAGLCLHRRLSDTELHQRSGHKRQHRHRNHT